MDLHINLSENAFLAMCVGLSLMPALLVLCHSLVWGPEDSETNKGNE